MEVLGEPNINYPEQLEEVIPDDATCISVKVNLDDGEYSESQFVPPHMSDIIAYLKDSGVEIISSTAGVHLEGRNQIPHIHYHFITSHYNPPSNPSQHRKRWLNKADNSECDLGDATFKYQKIDKKYPVYQFLSYPLKEGKALHPRYYKFIYLFDKQPMEKGMIDFLKSVGTTIYQTQLALKLKQDKTQERKQLALKELYDICVKQSFSSYSAMMCWLDDNYIAELDLEEMPDPKNYKTNCQKIAVKLGLLKYSQI